MMICDEQYYIPEVIEPDEVDILQELGDIVKGVGSMLLPDMLQQREETDIGEQELVPVQEFKMKWYQQQLNIEECDWDESHVYQLNCLLNDQSLFSDLLSRQIDDCEVIFRTLTERLTRMFQVARINQQQVTEAEERIREAVRHLQAVQSSVQSAVRSGHSLQNLPKFKRNPAASEFDRDNALTSTNFTKPVTEDDDAAWIEYVFKALKRVMEYIDKVLIPFACLLISMSTVVCPLVIRCYPVKGPQAATMSTVLLALPPALSLIKVSLEPLVFLLENVNNSLSSYCVIM